MKLPQIPIIKSKKSLFAILGFVIFVDLIWMWVIFTSPVNPVLFSQTYFIIEKGEQGKDIARRLYEQGLIKSPFLFRAYSVLGGVSNKLQAGEYAFSPSMRMPEIVNRLANGNFVDRKLRLLEGWSLKNIAENLETQELFSQDELFNVTGLPGVDLRSEPDMQKSRDFSKEFPFLKEKPEYVSLEGYLFPDTYRISKGEDPEDIVRRALHNFEQKITPEILEEIKAQEKTLFEILTMASIIEKEVRSLQDKKIVSGILWKRMEHDVRLQVDATIVYVREGNYYKVTFEELKVESPYNTYTNYGLPPGPISNPGLESIEAALYPTESPYWFYLSPNINTTIFSKTFEQHKAAADLYIR